MNRPEHLRGPEWEGLERLYEPSEITFEPWPDPTSTLKNVMINGVRVGWMMPRPLYCDRGHWQVNSELPDIDAQDSFPRYYMSETTARNETIAWLNWRLWRISPLAHIARLAMP